MPAPTATQGAQAGSSAPQKRRAQSGRFLRDALHQIIKAPIWVPLLFGGDNWNYHPHFTAFHALSPPLEKPHNHALFRVFCVCTRNRKNTNFQKIRVRFVYEAAKVKSFLNGSFSAPNNLLHVAELSQIFVCIIILQASSFESDTALVKKTKKKNHKIY